MIFNLFEVLAIVFMSYIMYFGWKKFRDSRKELTEGEYRRKLLEQTLGKPCVLCNQFHAEIYVKEHGWVHAKCWEEIIKL